MAGRGPAAPRRAADGGSGEGWSNRVPENILIIDDDESLSRMLADYLGTRGFVADTSSNANDGLATLRRARFDAVVLDVMLPDLDGFEVCRRVRARSDIPILMLTARGEDLDRIVGLELGADDYLPKPFNPRELVARLRAILRRSRRGPGVDEGTVFRFGDLTIDRPARTVRLGDRHRPLTGYQFDLLDALVRNAGRVMSREQLMIELQGKDLESFDRSIDVHISRIRAMIEKDPRRPRHILTIRGVGYVFARGEDDREGR